MFVGCAPWQQQAWSPGDPGLQVVSGVPFRAQQARDDCGPAALASVLAHRQVDIPLNEITREVYSPVLGGSLLPDMENFAAALGFRTRSGRGDLELLRQTVASGRPVILPLQTGFGPLSKPHYIVVFGFDGERFLVHYGTREGVFLPAKALLARWEPMDRLYLYLE